MEATIIKELISTLIAAAVVYIGFINNLRTKVAVLEDNVDELQKKCKEATDKFEDMVHKNSVLEEKVKRSEQRQDNYSKKNDDITNLITEFKMEVMERISNVNVQMSKISSDVENINNTIAIFDGGIVSKKKKKNQ